MPSVAYTIAELYDAEVPPSPTRTVTHNGQVAAWTPAPGSPPAAIIAWCGAVQAEAARMCANAPDLASRIADATELVLTNQVELGIDGHATVASRTTEGLRYEVNGVCQCKDATYNTAFCAHRIAVSLVKRATKALATTPVTVPDAPVQRCGTCFVALEAGEVECSCAHDVPAQSALPAQTQGIAPEYIVYIKGRPYPTYQGLLIAAQAQGLLKLEARFISVTDVLALAEATATFSDGRIYTEAADATPSNVGAQVKPHFPRMALVRAKARALRDALGALCAVEELGDVSEK